MSSLLYPFYPAVRVAPPAIIGEPIVVTPPAALPLSLAELRAQCRLTDDDSADDDPLLMAYLRSAVDYVEGYTGLALISQTIAQTFSNFPVTWFGRLFPQNALTLGRRPLQSVTSIEYLDAAGAEQTLDPLVYRVAGSGGQKTVASLRLATGQTWPSVYVDAEAVTINYVAGFGDTHNDVPEVVRHALMLLVAYYYNQREAGLIDPQIVEVPFGVHALLEPWRQLGVA